jgi:4-amino-4-deoxy-L-arabinose transferase-like glycosyltransferase
MSIGLTTIIGLYLRSESWIGTTVRRPLQSDASDYFYYAFNMSYHDTYSREISQSADAKYKPTPDAVRSPGYPLVLSFLIDGPPGRKLIKKIQLFQMLVSTLTLILAFFFFKSFLPPLLGGVAALLMALSPHLIIFNSYILSETLFCFTLVLIGLLICRYVRQPSWWFSIVLGSILGIGSLVRPSLQFFPLVLAIMLSIHYGRKAGLKLAFLILLGFILTMSPWYIRNIITLGKASDTSLMIKFLHHGLYPDFKYKQKQESYRRPYKYDPRSEKISKNLISVFKEIKTRFRAHPLKHLEWFLIKKPALFWSWNTVQGHGDVFVYYVSNTPFSQNKTFQWTHRLMRIIHGPLVLMSFLGSLLVWIVPQSAKINDNIIFSVRFVGALLLYYTILHMIGVPFPRYSVPLRPFQYGMAMFFLYNFYKIVKTRKVVL